MLKFIQAMLTDAHGGKTTLTFYPYRKRLLPHPWLCQMKYDYNDEVCQVQHLLAELVGRRHDNHTCYTIENEAGMICLRFSDWSCTVGLRLTGGDGDWDMKLPGVAVEIDRDKKHEIRMKMNMEEED